MNFFEDDTSTKSKIIGAIIAIIIMFILEPFLIFWISYFGGWLAKLMIGSHLIKGLNLLHIAIELNQIPLLAGTLGWIGAFFHNIINSNNNK
jgi:hypothetical protein